MSSSTPKHARKEALPVDRVRALIVAQGLPAEGRRLPHTLDGSSMIPVALSAKDEKDKPSRVQLAAEVLLRTTVDLSASDRPTVLDILQKHDEAFSKLKDGEKGDSEVEKAQKHRAIQHILETIKGSALDIHFMAVTDVIYDHYGPSTYDGITHDARQFLGYVIMEEGLALQEATTPDELQMTG